MSYGADHTHYGLAEEHHSHSDLASTGHTHNGYEIYDVAPERHEHMLSQVAGAAAADHDHDTEHDHDGEYIPRAAVADMLEAFRLEYRGKLNDLEARIDARIGRVQIVLDELEAAVGTLEADELEEAPDAP